MYRYCALGRKKCSLIYYACEEGTALDDNQVGT
jgi:hypothetical protein